MAEKWEQTVPCRDGFDRERYAQVVITDTNDVALIPPPGGAAVFHPGDIGRVQEVLLAAQMEAIHRRGGGR
jgi:hypothetical protein